MPLIDCKIHLELNWIEDYILPSAADSAKFKITNVKLLVTIITLSTKDNNGFKSLLIGTIIKLFL